MRKNSFYTLVGIFVLGSLALMIVGGMLVYKNHLKSEVQTYVIFFKGSLKGLDISTPITYRGVKIGEVKLIEITENKAGNNVVIPVYVEFFVEKTLGFSTNPVNLLIANGFVADISKPNFLTGIADIELVKLKPVPKTIKQTFFRGYPIFPSRNTVDKYSSIDDSLKAANKMFNDISDLVKSRELRETIDATRLMVDSINELARNTDQYLPSVTAYLTQSLKKIGNAAESTQNLTDYLARNPESLIRGKR
ncbi:MlaD family protein [Legionella sp. CNM-4043-24]|uniref:MlaD family protein n=1 Tax=Legionella sp. CNM-4043-24 TaxID=3421646 RepID=UPI00403A9598